MLFARSIFLANLNSPPRRSRHFTARSCVLLVAMALLGISCSHAAKADMYQPLFQITSAPDLSYFAIRAFGLDDPPRGFVDPDPVWRKHLSEAYGLFTAAALQQKPYECDLPGLRRAAGGRSEPWKVIVTGTFNLVSRGPCVATGSNIAHVFVADRDLGSLSADPSCDQTSVPQTTEIEASDIGSGPYFRRCDISFVPIYRGMQPEQELHPVRAACEGWEPTNPNTQVAPKRKSRLPASDGSDSRP